MPPQQYQNQTTATHWPIGRLLVLLVIMLAVVFGFFWAANRSYLEVAVEGTNGEVSYQLIKQGTKEKIEGKSTAKSIKITAKKGTYEILVHGSSKSYFALADTKGFLSTTKVSATLESEKARTFIGNDPGTCMNLASGNLVSYRCGEGLSSLRLHVPATASLPTHLMQDTATEDVVEGMVNTKKGTVLVVFKALTVGHEQFEDQDTPHQGYILTGKTAIPTDGQGVAGLDGEHTYQLYAYKDGFVAYRKPFSGIFYFATVKSVPKSIKLGDLPKDETPYIVRTSGDNLLAGFSRQPEASRTGSEVFVKTDKATKHFDFGTTYKDFRFCGTDRLCALHRDNTLDVFDISGSDASLQFSLANVRSMVSSDGQFMVQRGKEVIELDTVKRTGHVQYTYGDYESCGLYPAPTSYLVCIIGDDDKKAVLHIDQSGQSDNIDKKVLSLRRMAEVTDVSIYGRYIFVSPNGGGVEYIKSEGIFDYNPATLRKSNAKIREGIKNLKIDPNVYRVKNNLE